MHLFSEITQTEREYYDLYQNPDRAYREFYDNYIRDGMAQAFKEYVKPHLIIEKDSSRLPTYRTEIIVLSVKQAERIGELIQDIIDLGGYDNAKASDYKYEIGKIIKATTLEVKDGTD